MSMNRGPVSRRGLLRSFGIAALVPVLAACGAPPSAPPTKSPANAAPRAQPTAPPVVTTAPSLKPTVAPAPAATSAPVAAGKMTVKFLMRYPPYKDSYEKVLGDFSTKKPEIQVQTNWLSGDWLQQILVQYAGGVAPDATFATGAQWQAFAAKDAILPLDDYVKKESEFQSWQVVPYWLETDRLAGKLYGITLDPQTVLLYFNKTLLDKAGVKPPDPLTPLTWDALAKLAQHVTIDGNGKTPLDAGFKLERMRQYGMEGWFNNIWWHLIRQNGGELFSTDLRTTRIGEKPAVDATQYMTDLVTRYQVMAPPQSSATEQSQVTFTFLTGRVAFGIWNLTETAQLKGTKAFDWDVAPLPQFAGQPRKTLGWGSPNIILKKTLAPDGAWEWVKFLSGPPGQNVWLGLGASQPMYTIQESTTGWVNGSPPKNRKAPLAEPQWGVPPPFVPAYPQLNDTWNKEVINAYQGKSSAGEVIKKLVPQINQLLEKQYQDYGSLAG